MAQWINPRPPNFKVVARNRGSDQEKKMPAYMNIEIGGAGVHVRSGWGGPNIYSIYRYGEWFQSRIAGLFCSTAPCFPNTLLLNLCFVFLCWLWAMNIFRLGSAGLRSSVPLVLGLSASPVVWHSDPMVLLWTDIISIGAGQNKHP